MAKKEEFSLTRHFMGLAAGTGYGSVAAISGLVVAVHVTQNTTAAMVTCAVTGVCGLVSGYSWGYGLGRKSDCSCR